MNNIMEFASKASDYISEDKFKDAILNAMEKANTIEELLILKWHFGKLFNLKYYTIKCKSFNRNVERISYRNALINSSSIINDILNDCDLEYLKDKYTVTTNSLKTIVINYLESANYNQDILDKLDIFEKHSVPEHDRNLCAARTAVKLFIKYNCYSYNKAREKLGCSSDDFYVYLNIIKNNDEVLYKAYYSLFERYQKRNSLSTRCKTVSKEAKIKRNMLERMANLTPEQILDILSGSNCEEYSSFCVYYKLSSNLLKVLLKDNENLKYELAYNKDNIFNIYNQYVDKFKLLAHKVIYEIVDLSKNNFETPLNLYDYYTYTRCDINVFSRLVLNFEDVKNGTIISSYLKKSYDITRGFDRKSIDVLKQRGTISCASKSLCFTNREFSNALKDIKEKNLPLQKGVLYYSIKRQIELRDKNVKKKIL